MTIAPLQALWASLFVTAIYPIVGKFATGYVSPSLILLFGTLITVLYYTPWLTRNNMWRRFLDKKVFKNLLVVGLFGTALPFLLILIALNYTTPGNAAILNQVEVVYSLILTAIFLKERPTAMQIFGTLMVVTGVALILFSEGFSVHLKGDLIVIATVWMFQVSHIAAKKLPADLQPNFISAGRALFGFFWTIPLTAVLVFFIPMKFSFSWPTLGIIFYMGLINYGIGNALWYRAIRNMDLSKATAVILSYPVLTYIFSVIAGLDKINMMQITGLILALMGAYTVTSIIKKGNKKNEISAI